MGPAFSVSADPHDGLLETLFEKYVKDDVVKVVAEGGCYGAVVEP